MAQIRVLQRRIRTVKNAKQITKALEVVAASRMRRVVGIVPGSRLYGDLAGQIMSRMASSPEASAHPYFFLADTDSPALYIIFTSDRGQAGAFNSNIFNLALAEFKNERHRPRVIAVGRKGARFFSRLSGLELAGVYENIADSPDPNVFVSLIDTVNKSVIGGEVGRVIIIYTSYVSSLSQISSRIQLLPISPDQLHGDQISKTVYEFEPEVKDVLSEAGRLYVEARLMQARIESAASEHAMRMIAMGNANRNASDLIDSLTLELNATRQSAITQEIAEITGGAAAIAA